MPERADLFKLTVDQMHEGIQIIDRDWRYIYLNEAAAAHARNDRTKLLGRTMQQCYPGIEETEMFRLLKRVMNRRHPARMENRFEYPDGQKAWFALFFEPHVEGILIRSVDIGETKKIEERYLHVQKMEAIGRLAGGIAHDFNNKMSVVRLYVDLAINESSDPGQVSSHLNKAIRAIDGATKLTRQLLAFSRKQVLDMKVVNLNDLVSGFGEGLVKLLGSDVRIQMDLDPSLGNVLADVSQMDQVLMNLAFNARDAMPNGGVLTIETANVEFDRSFCESRPGLEPGSYVMIAVSDTGIGMKPEVKSRIFEPFFTTKPAGHGSGLGLSSVQGIVEQSRGYVWVYSEPGLGSSFKIYLPRVTELAQAVEYSPEPEKSLQGTETIMVVEDDEALRSAVVRSLETAGYRIVSVGSTPEAKAAFMEAQGKIDLLLTDVVLASGSGHQLAKDLSGIKKDLIIAFMSGYTENAIVHHGVLDTGAILIQKPVSMRKLLNTVRSILDGRLKKGVI